MEVKLRKTAIDVVGDVPWGTHFCQFYKTKKDLIRYIGPLFQWGAGEQRILHTGDVWGFEPQRNKGTS